MQIHLFSMKRKKSSYSIIIKLQMKTLMLISIKWRSNNNSMAIASYKIIPKVCKNYNNKRERKGRLLYNSFVQCVMRMLIAEAIMNGWIITSINALGSKAYLRRIIQLKMTAATAVIWTSLNKRSSILIVILRKWVMKDRMLIWVIINRQ